MIRKRTKGKNKKNSKKNNKQWKHLEGSVKARDTRQSKP
jgi:hypothetical protein